MGIRHGISAPSNLQHFMRSKPQMQRVFFRWKRQRWNRWFSCFLWVENWLVEFGGKVGCLICLFLLLFLLGNGCIGWTPLVDMVTLVDMCFFFSKFHGHGGLTKASRNGKFQMFVLTLLKCALEPVLHLLILRVHSPHSNKYSTSRVDHRSKHFFIKCFPRRLTGWEKSDFTAYVANPLSRGKCRLLLSLTPALRTRPRMLVGKVLAPKPQKSGRKGSKMGEGRPPDPGVACFYTSGGSVKKGPVVPSGMGTS